MSAALYGSGSNDGASGVAPLPSAAAMAAASLAKSPVTSPSSAAAPVRRLGTFSAAVADTSDPSAASAISSANGRGRGVLSQRASAAAAASAVSSCSFFLAAAFSCRSYCMMNTHAHSTETYRSNKLKKKGTRTVVSARFNREHNNRKHLVQVSQPVSVLIHWPYHLLRNSGIHCSLLLSHKGSLCLSY